MSNGELIDALLTDLAASGWTISWAFQYAPQEWRVTIIKTEAWNGYDQPDYRFAHCAFANTFADALEDAMCKRNEATFFKSTETNYEMAPKLDITSLFKASAKPHIARRL